MSKNIDLKHVAIILDGNRRFAKKLMLEPWKGHGYGKEKVEEILDYAKEFGITELTFYTLSQENIKNRPEKELNFLYKLLRETFTTLDKEKIQREKTKMKFIGDLSLLPEDIKSICLNLESETKDNNQFTINFCIAYGGKQELIQAIKKIIKKQIDPKDLNEEIIKENLYLQSEPDMIIRTGGQKRSSNFLLWQSGYSEWFFLDKMWPEFEKQDFSNCIEEFKQRKRNFGA
jgi:tritrans,polycis-undecaprenyl-diphosphate synthase [geranylgeranyl-diphosphate specific]